MRSALAIVVLGLMSACASKPVATNACSDPRPMVCTMEFDPTCAVLGSGGRKEYSSPCTACADPAVTGYASGACPE